MSTNTNMSVKIQSPIYPSLRTILHYLLDENKKMSNEAAKFLKTAPKGCLSCDRRGGKTHYRHRTQINGHSSDTFLANKDSQLITALALKPYYKLIGKYTSNNLKLIELCLNEIIPDAKEKALSKLPVGVRDVASSYFASQPQWIKDWMYADYKTSSFYPENKTIKTLSGICVRTKSEEKIADTLTNSGLAFRYEPLLLLGGVARYPDFVILHPASTPQHLILIIWEHAGMMDDMTKYVPEAFNKLELYAKNGLIINLNMIYTTETRTDRLSTDTVKFEISRILNMTKGSPIIEIEGCYEIVD